MAILLKHSWGLIMGIGILGVIFRYGWFVPNIFNYSGWRILGRTSYATFICHLFILKLLMSGIHQPMYLSVFNIVSLTTRLMALAQINDFVNLQMCYVCAVFGISNVVGFILTLTVEIPIGSLCKLTLIKQDSVSSVDEIPMSGRTKATQGQ
jgi:peptidoglycan/LPS O-acetylase OafA/YrhL